MKLEARERKETAVLRRLQGLRALLTELTGVQLASRGFARSCPLGQNTRLDARSGGRDGCPEGGRRRDGGGREQSVGR